MSLAAINILGSQKLNKNGRLFKNFIQLMSRREHNMSSVRAGIH